MKLSMHSVHILRDIVPPAGVRQADFYINETVDENGKRCYNIK